MCVVTRLHQCYHVPRTEGSPRTFVPDLVEVLIIFNTFKILRGVQIMTAKENLQRVSLVTQEQFLDSLRSSSK